MRRITSVLILVMLVGFGYLWLSRPVHDPALTSEGSPPQETVLPEQREGPARPPGNVQREEASAHAAGEATLTVDTIDSLGKPLIGVRLLWSRKRPEAQYSKDELVELGVTGENGRGRVSAPGSGIVVGVAGGYSPAEIEIASDTAHVQLQLRQGGRVRIECFTVGGQPLAGVSVAVGKTPVKPTPYRRVGNLIPSDTLVGSFGRGITDASGRFEWDTLPLGQSLLQARHPEQVLLSWDRDRVVEVGEATQVARARFGRIYGILFSLFDSSGAPLDTLTWAVATPRGFSLPPMSADDLRAQQDVICDKAARSSCILWGYRESNPSIAPAEAQMQVLTEKFGWVTIRPKIRTLGELVEPEAVIVSKLPENPCVRARVDLVDGAGVLWPQVKLQLTMKGQPPIEVVTGEVAMLPEGQYSASCPNGMLAEALRATKVNVLRDDSAGNITIATSATLRKGMISIHSNLLDSSKLRGMIFLSTSNPSRGIVMATFSAGRHELLVTDGDIECTVDASDHVRARVPWHVSKEQTQLAVEVRGK